MKTRILLTSILLAFAVVSFNKDQRAVKRLDGKWKLTKYNNQAVPEAQAAVITFTSCKLKTDELCDVSVTTGSQTQSYKYLVKNEGKTIIVKDNTGAFILQEMTIETLDKTTLVLKYTEDGEQVTNEYVKQ
jgi:hypothetical protein